MANYFLDTSAFVKRYHPETGSDRVLALFSRLENQIVVLARFLGHKLIAAVPKPYLIAEFVPHLFQKRLVMPELCLDLILAGLEIAHVVRADPARDPLDREADIVGVAFFAIARRGDRVEPHVVRAAVGGFRCPSRVVDNGPAGPA